MIVIVILEYLSKLLGKIDIEIRIYTIGVLLHAII